MSAEKDFLLQLFLQLTKSEMLHLGFWNENDPVTWASIPEAQRRYAEFVIGRTPEATRSILDVGCGTGCVSMMLHDAGFSVECVSPDILLNEKIREKYGDTLTLHCSRFEDLDVDRSYDLILMMESLCLFRIGGAFSQCRKYLNSGGAVLVSDFFRKRDRRDYRKFHTLKGFTEAAKKHGFHIRSSHDITQRVLPTVELAGRAYREYVLPVMRSLADSIDHSTKRKGMRGYRLLWKGLRLLFRKAIHKTRDNLLTRIPRLVDGDNFLDHVRYMVYLLDFSAGRPVRTRGTAALPRAVPRNVESA